VSTSAGALQARPDTRSAAQRRGRVVSVAKCTATIGENPKTTTKAYRTRSCSPTSHWPQSAQSTWTCTPGPVSKRTSGRPAGRPGAAGEPGGRTRGRAHIAELLDLPVQRRGPQLGIDAEPADDVAAWAGVSSAGRALVGTSARSPRLHSGGRSARCPRTPWRSWRSTTRGVGAARASRPSPPHTASVPPARFPASTPQPWQEGPSVPRNRQGPRHRPRPLHSS
jgi:hypothetical protein